MTTSSSTPWRDGVGNAVIITSQPDYKGEPASIEFIRDSMRTAHFQPLPEIGAFYRQSDNIAVMDLHTENAVRDGNQLHVFDAIISQPAGELRELLIRTRS